MCRGAVIISFSAARIRLRTRMRPQCLVFALVVALLRVAPAASWWGVAHMLTAQVAKDCLFAYSDGKLADGTDFFRATPMDISLDHVF